jgi:hypothetical protein
VEQLWTELGLQVQELTRENSPDTGYIGAKKVIAIAPDSHARGLAIGDLIVAINSMGTSSATRRLMLIVVRGDQRFSVTVEIRSAAPGAVVPTGPDASAARAYRDKLRERVQLLERSFKAGEVPISAVLKERVQLDDAEIAAAASPAERQTARRQKVEHLQELKTMTDRAHKAGEAVQTDVLAVEAELLKAEAEMTADRGAASSPPALRALPETPTLPSIWLPAAGGSAGTLKSPSAFREELETAEREVADIKRRLERWRLQGRPTEGPGAASQEAFDDALKQRESRLAFAREEYNAQLRLLEIDVLDATNEWNTANNKRAMITALFQSSTIPKTEKDEADRAAQAAKLRLERANTLLELYRKADPKSAPAPEPQTDAKKT